MTSILSPSCLRLRLSLVFPGRRSCLFSSSVCGASSRSVLSLCSSNITVPGNLNLPHLQRDRVLSSVPVVLLLFFSNPLFCVCVSNQRSIVCGRTTTPACLFRVLNLTLILLVVLPGISLQLLPLIHSLVLAPRHHCSPLARCCKPTALGRYSSGESRALGLSIASYVFGGSSRIFSIDFDSDSIRP